ncbi:MAG: hypothetical protein ACTHU0_39555 [Kofleriaceae bacterium]
MLSTTAAPRPVAGRALPTRGRVDHELLALLSPWARRLMAAGVGAGDVGDRQFLRDLQRDDVATRQPNHTLARMVRLSIGAPDAVTALALSEVIRRRVLAGRGDTPRLGDLEVFDRETEAQLHADQAQWRYVRFRDRAAWEDAVQCLERQSVATRAALDWLYAHPVP